MKQSFYSKKNNLHQQKVFIFDVHVSVTNVFYEMENGLSELSFLKRAREVVNFWRTDFWDYLSQNNLKNARLSDYRFKYYSLTLKPSISYK